jgi:hypothetical protein
VTYVRVQHVEQNAKSSSLRDKNFVGRVYLLPGNYIEEESLKKCASLAKWAGLLMQNKILNELETKGKN